MKYHKGIICKESDSIWQLKRNFIVFMINYKPDIPISPETEVNKMLLLVTIRTPDANFKSLTLYYVVTFNFSYRCTCNKIKRAPMGY